MKHAFVALSLTLPLLGGCASDPYGSRPNIGTRTMGGALIGAAVGALAGHSVGTDPITGAAVGMVAGGAVGAATTARVRHGRQYYRDSRGYCYYVDPNGRPVYDPAVTC